MRGNEPTEKKKSRLVVRITPEMHKHVRVEAALADQSINDFATEALIRLLESKRQHRS